MTTANRSCSCGSGDTGASRYESPEQSSGEHDAGDGSGSDGAGLKIGHTGLRATSESLFAFFYNPNDGVDVGTAANIALLRRFVGRYCGDAG